MKRKIKSAFTERKRGEPHQFDPDFHGPVKKRSCTDVLCCLLFGVFLIGWAAVVVIAIIRGEPDRLLLPTDSRGQVCGKDKEVVDKPYLFFFDFTRCASPKVPFTGCPTPQICVKSCPTENWFYNPLSDFNNISMTYCKKDVHPTKDTMKQLILKQECAGYYIHSQSIARRCIPANLEDISVEILKFIFEKSADLNEQERFDTIVSDVYYAGRFVKYEKLLDGIAEDIKNTWYILILACCLSMLISFIWIVLLRLIAKVMIWFSLIAFTGLSGYAAYYTMQEYLASKNDPMKNKLLTNRTEHILSKAMSTDVSIDHETMWLVAFIVTVVFFLICFIILIFMRKRVRIAIALIHEASKAVASIMSTLFFPILPFLFHVIVLILFCATTFMLASVGNPEYRIMCNSEKEDCSCSPAIENSTCNPKEFLAPDCTENQVSCQFFSHTTDRDIQYLHIYNVFMLLWTMFFVSAFAEFVLAGSFASWYWSFDKKKDMPAMPVAKSITVALRYHVGTIAFGSLIIAIVRGIRLIFEYIDYKVKQVNNSILVKILSCCCRCCLWCLEKFLRFVNRNAYIYCAIYGTNFCTSARKSFSLLMRNILRVMTVDLVTDFLLLIGKLVVTGLMAILTFVVFNRGPESHSEFIPKINYIFTPVVIITVATYFIACSFFNVYEMAVDTLFFCFLEDGERNDGSPEKPYFMSKELMQIFDKSNKAKKKE